MGCFKDRSPRDLANAFYYSNSMTIQLCIDYCETLNYKYAGLQYR